MTEIIKTELKNAVTQYTLWEDFCNSPLGVLWVNYTTGQNGKKIALVLNIISVQFYRRKKVATKLLDCVSLEAETMITSSVSDDGGKEFSEKYGFKYNDKLNLWAYKKGD